MICTIQLKRCMNMMNQCCASLFFAVRIVVVTTDISFDFLI
ncbi:unnamed protein product [Schistosoma margrebowiei]|uniref:Uncharacterized protein n=1 Tax=Schistosoma margrebowiei TaxID=48269 RepID=A0A183MJH9_9TREM|nr:unnamed protein product [Schistosoma margrebowiei]